MAVNVISLDCSDDEYGFVRNVKEKEPVQGEDEKLDMPRVKTKRRGLARQKTLPVVNKVENDFEEHASSLFRFSSAPAPSRQILADSSDDEELFVPKCKSKRMQARSITKDKNGPKANKLEPYKAQSIEIFDDRDDTHENSINEQNGDLNSSDILPPTPPTPPVDSVPVVKRSRRQPRGVKTAINKLNKVKARFQRENNESDLSITEVCPAPVASPNERSEMLVKVRSRSGVQRFPLLVTDSFESVMRMMAKREGVAEEQIVMFINDTTIQPYDSPASLKLHIADIIDCHVRSADEVEQSRENLDKVLQSDPEAISLRIQGRDVKSKMTVWVKKHESLERVMKKFASTQDQKITQLEFHFDGEKISTTDTVQSLDLEDGDCIDVIDSQATKKKKKKVL